MILVYNNGNKTKGDKMNTLTAITVTQESLEGMVTKMLRANIEEYKANQEETVAKYMKLALDLKNKAFNYLQENKDEFLKVVEFSLKVGK